MTKRLLACLSFALVAAIVQAGEKSYSLNGQAVTDAGVSITFTDNGTGGTGSQLVAQSVFVKNDGATNEVYCNLRSRTIGTTADRMIAAGEGFTYTASEFNDDRGYFGLSCICATGESTTLRVLAVAR